MFDLNAYISEKQCIINAALDKLFNANTYNARLTEAMRYSLMAGGKRIRPILLLATAEAVGMPDTQALIPGACALEVIHTYSLIHDDLPAMDNDDLRRGKPTCHIQFDEVTAILAGDALLTFAFDILSSDEKWDKSVDIGKRLKVIHIISDASGHKGMVGGQMLDMMHQGNSIDLKRLKEMHDLKTGALIKASVMSGAVLAGGNDDQIAELKKYAEGIGIAFQVTDDILDVEGDAAILGKAVGADAALNKNTYPILMGLEPSKRFASQEIERAVRALKDFGKKAEPLRAIACYIITRKK